MALIGKIKIEGSIELLSGLHIGGNQTNLEIGSIDNQVIKTNQNTPYIPGSSLKGKLRNMLARVAGSQNVDGDIKLKDSESDINNIATLFGIPEKEETDRSVRSEALLKIQDCFPKKVGTIEIKNENTIKRLTGEANPRQLERVEPNTIFSLNMILDVVDNDETKHCLEELALAMKLLEMDALGGGGSRGNGRIKFKIDRSVFYKIQQLKLVEDNEDFVKELKEFSDIINRDL